MIATWRILRDYVVSLLLMGIRKIGIPVAMSFGSAGAFPYDQLYRSLSDVHNISFNRDQTNVLLSTLFAIDIICGNSLTSGCARGGAKKKVQSQIGSTTRCKVQRDWNEMNDLYFLPFTMVIEADDAEGPRKIELCINNGKTIITHPEK
jgi:hypothetical protein